MKDNTKIIISISLAVAVIVGFLIVFFSASNVTKRMVHRLAIEAREAQIDKNHTMEEKDGWGRNLIFVYTYEKYQEVYSVISHGADGQLGTDDDLRYDAIDFNKSRIAGKWLADKTTEAARGIKDSLKETLKGNPKEEKDKEDKSFMKDIGKKAGEVIKDLKEGFSEGKNSE